MPLITEISINPEILSKLKFTHIDGKLSIWVLDNDKPRIATPEETIRQLVVAALIVQYKYPPDRIACEFVIQIGINRPRADIVIFNEKQTIETIIEVKVYNTANVVNQISSYMHASGAKYGAAVLTKATDYIHRTQDGIIIPIADIPIYGNHTTSEQSKEIDEIKSISPLESLRRITKNEVILTYKGESVKLENNDAASLVKVKRAFLAEGLALKVKNTEAIKWSEHIAHAIDSAEIVNNNQINSITQEEQDFLTTLQKIHIPGNPKILLTEAISSQIKNINNKTEVNLHDRLLRAGIRIENNTILFANLLFGSLLEGTKYNDSWKQILKSIASAHGLTGTVARFADKTSRCTRLPAHLLSKNSP